MNNKKIRNLKKSSRKKTKKIKMYWIKKENIKHENGNILTKPKKNQNSIEIGEIL